MISTHEIKESILRKLAIRSLTDEEKSKMNIPFIKEIEPKGGADFTDPRFAITGTGYEACLYIYEYPKNVQECWLDKIMSIDGAIVVLDIGTIDKAETIKNLGKSLSEQSSRINTAKKDLEKREAYNIYNDITDMYDEISTFSNVMKVFVARIYIPANTMYEADTKLKEVIDELEPSYKASVCINETKQDFINVFIPYKEQQKSIYARKGQPMLASTLALGNPFHFDTLQDPFGHYLGQTSTGGTVFWDLFYSDMIRMSYNFLLVGAMGSGKSTLLKIIMKERAIRGDFVRVFDVEGEFVSECKYLGGKVISLDGNSAAKINIFQILPLEDNELSYSSNISKIKTIYKYLKPNASEDELELLEKLLSILYMEYGIIDSEGMVIRDIDTLEPTDFPILSDFVRLIKAIQDSPEENSHIVREGNLNYLSSIELKLENLATNYKNMFDGHTTFPNIYDEQVIVFNLKNLVNLDSTIFDAQLFSAISLVWSNAVSKGKEQKDLFENGEVQLWDIIHSLLIIDESHLICNASKIMGVLELTKMSRQGRKYFAGLGLASQRISDYIPEKISNEAYDELKTLFALTTYRFLMQQDASDVARIKEIFHGQITEEEAEKIPKFERGQCIFSIKSYKNLEIANTYLSDEDKNIFRGGM